MTEVEVGFDWGPLPKVHERREQCQMAMAALETFVLNWAKEYDLTSAEKTHLLHQLLFCDSGYLVSVERKGT